MGLRLVSAEAVPLEIKKAERMQSKLKLAIWGPSNSGKTFSSLLLAKGIGSKIILIDSERGSATKHSDKPGIPEFFTINPEQLEPEFYIRAIKMAVSAGADVIIIDSMTHSWNATKTIANEAGEASKNKFVGWGAASPRRQALIDTILQTPIHFICTMRAKTEYAIEKDERTGKMKPVKLGLGPDEKQDAEYEYDIIFSIDQDHNVTVQKDRTDTLNGLSGQPLTESVGAKLKAWLDAGAENPEINKPTEERRRFVFVLLTELGLSYEDPSVKERLKSLTKKESMTLWSEADTESVIKTLEQKIKEKHPQIKTA